MALKYSTALRQGLAVTGSLRSLLNEGLIRIYSGAVPASADSDLGSATLLNEISAGGSGTVLTFEPTASGGVLTKTIAENWTGNNVGDGTPTFFRFVKATDTGTASNTEVRLQGTCGAVGNDLIITQLPLVSGQPLTLELFQLTVPEQ